MIVRCRVEEQTQNPRLRSFSLIVVLMAFLVYAGALLVTYIGSNDEMATAAGIARATERTRPVADVYLSAAEAPVSVVAAAEEPPAPAVVANDRPDGEKIYASACFACHTSGATGAPIPGSDAMSERAEKGLDALLQTAVSGLNAMPPRGGRPDLSDEQILAAIKFMLR